MAPTKDPTEYPKFKPYATQFVFALLGLASAIYLFVQHTRLKFGIQGSASFCSVGTWANCDVVNASEYAEVLGIPLAAIGSAYFFFILLLLLLGQPGKRNFVKAQGMIAWLCAIGLLLDIPLLGVQLFSIKSLCLLCCLSYVCSAAILIAASRFGPLRERMSWKRLKSQTPFGFVPTAFSTLGLACFIAVLMMVPSCVKEDSTTYTRVDDAMVQYYEAWKRLPVRPIPIKATDGSFGNAQANVKVVVFSDFQCPFCKRAAFTVSTALQSLKDKVHLVFKHYPLDPSCNPALKHNLHAHACEMAKLAYCARMKGKFWEFHDRVFFNLEETDFAKGTPALQAALKDFFTPNEWAQCQASDGANQSVAEDIRTGDQLGVKGTPTIFINGKQVGIPLTVENLQKLVELEF